MKFGEIATFIDACSGLASALSGSATQELAEIAAALRDHSDEKTSAFAKKVAKLKRTEGAGLLGLLPIVDFCGAAAMPKHAKALRELSACSIKNGLNSPQQLREALQAPVEIAKTPKSLSAEVINLYAQNLSVPGLSYEDASKIISAIDGDKKIKVTDAREIAARVLGVTMLKGRTRTQYFDEIRSRFIVLDREERKREASEAVSKPWGDS
jgi:hypothetical protein